jgi:hypothetical protein
MADDMAVSMLTYPSKATLTGNRRRAREPCTEIGGVLAISHTYQQENLGPLLERKPTIRNVPPTIMTLRIRAQIAIKWRGRYRLPFHH